MSRVIGFRSPRVRMAGAFDTLENLSAAAQSCASRGFEVLETYWSVPLVDEKSVVPKGHSRLGQWCFGAAMVALASALWFCSWVSSVSWPLNVGAKPTSSLPAFLPVVFEVTILVAALVPAAVFLLGMGSKKRLLLDEFVANDRFVLLVEGESSKVRRMELMGLLEEHEAVAVREVTEKA